MGRKFLIVTGFLAVFLRPGAVAGQGETYGDMEGAIYRSNYDGDTIRFDIPGVHPLLGRNIPVRLRGVDTPEIRGHCSRENRLAAEARAMVRKLLERSARITLRRTGRGKYFRILADIEADGVDLKSALLQAGLAVPYDGGRKSWNWCDDRPTGN